MKVAARSDEKMSFCEATAEYLPKIDRFVPETNSVNSRIVLYYLGLRGVSVWVLGDT